LVESKPAQLQEQSNVANHIKADLKAQAHKTHAKRGKTGILSNQILKGLFFELQA